MVLTGLLSSCLYFGDMRQHSRPLCATELEKKHSYQPPIVKNKQQAWWNSFLDSQLQQLIEVALADSPTMQKAEARVRRAEQISQGAKATLWPTIDFSGYLQREKFAEYGLIPPPFNAKTFNIGELGLNFNYEFDFWGKNRELLAARASETYAAQADRRQARLIISSAVATTYFQLLNDIEQVSLAKQNWQAAKELSAIVQDLTKNDIYSNIPLQTAVNNTQSAKLAVAQYQQAEALTRNKLAALLGKNPLSTTFVTRHYSYRRHQVVIPSNLTTNVLAQRPDIAAAQARVFAAAHEVNVAKTRFFPDINLSALFSYQTVKFGRLFDPGSQNNFGAVAVDLPIFDAGARRANLGTRYAEYDIAVESYNQTLLTALRDVADQLARLNTVKSQVATQRTAVAAINHQYKLILSRYNHGIVAYKDVLQAKQLLLQQQAIQAQLETRHLQTIVAMQRALGGESFREN